MNTVPLNSLVSQDSPICYGILMPGEDVAGGVPVVKVRDYDHRGIDVSSLLRTSPKIEARYRRSRLEPGDILMSIRGTTGVLTIVPPELKGANITQDSARIRVRAEESAYVYQALQAPNVQRQIRLRTIGQAVRGINISSVRDLRIPWPDAWKRKEVAAFLSKLDGRIEQIDSLYQRKIQYKRGLSQELFTGRSRFPEFRDVAWHTSPLENHVETVTRKNTKSCTLVLTASGEHGLVDQRRYFNRNVSGADISKYNLIKKGEFAYNRSAMNGYPYGATKRLDEHDEGVLSTLYLCFAVSDPELDSDYLSHVFESGILNRQLRPIVRIGARAHGLLNVSDDDFLSISIPFLDRKEQQKIASVLNDLDSEIYLLRRQRQLFQQYKRGLLAHLLSDELPAAV